MEMGTVIQEDGLPLPGIVYDIAKYDILPDSAGLRKDCCSSGFMFFL